MIIGGRRGRRYNRHIFRCIRRGFAGLGRIASAGCIVGSCSRRSHLRPKADCKRYCHARLYMCAGFYAGGYYKILCNLVTVYVFKIISYAQRFQPLLCLVRAPKRHDWHGAVVSIQVFGSGAYYNGNYAAGIHAFARGRLLIGYKLLCHGAAVRFSEYLNKYAAVRCMLPCLVKAQPYKARRVYCGTRASAEGLAENPEQRQHKHDCRCRAYGYYCNGGYLFLQALVA